MHGVPIGIWLWSGVVSLFFFPSPLHQILQSEFTSLSRLVSSSCWPVLWDCLLPIKPIWNWNQSCCKDYRTECQLCVFLLGGTEDQESSCSFWRTAFSFSKLIYTFLLPFCCSGGKAQHSLRQSCCHARAAAVKSRTCVGVTQGQPVAIGNLL